jgi:hypothetical protein
VNIQTFNLLLALQQSEAVDWRRCYAVIANNTAEGSKMVLLVGYIFEFILKHVQQQHNIKR